MFYFAQQSYSQSAQVEKFNVFLDSFFSDSKYQKSRVIFPFHERPSYINPKTERPVFYDTVTFKTVNEWKHISSDGGEKGSRFTIYTDTLRKATTKMSSEYRVLEFSKDDSDFNLILVFKFISSKWYLIRMEYFEP